MIGFKKAKQSFLIYSNLFHINIWLPGFALSIKYKNEWHRFSAYLGKEFDDGCFRLFQEIVYWKGKFPKNSYRKDSKKYLRFKISFRYRKRHKPWISNNPRAYE